MATTTRNANRRPGETPSVRRLAYIAVASLLVAGAFAIAYIHGSVALNRAQRTADCVNSVLAIRGPLTNADHANERQKIEDQKKAELDKERGLTQLSTAKNNRAAALAGFRLYQRGVSEFVQSLNDWIARDNVIAKQKALHPLGAC